MTDYDGDPVICAKCGLPIWEDEEIVEDGKTGETFPAFGTRAFATRY